MSVKRFDRLEGLSKPRYMDNGWVRVDAYIARAGVLEYTRADGSKWVEYRPHEEHSAEALASFDAVPFTNNHPEAGILDAENTKLYQVGTVLNPRNDGEKVKASILITDAKTVAAIKAGKCEMSCGYMADVEETPGELPDGTRYDAIQRNIRGNHVALVDSGRAGPEIRLKLDTRDAEVVLSPTDYMKIKLDNVDVEVAEPVAKHISTLESKISELEKAVDTEKARVDAASGEVETLKKELASAPEKVKAEIAARVALENSARSVLGDVKFDGKTDAEVKRAVAETSGLKLDGKSEAYVDAAYEIALQKAADAEKLKASVAGTTDVSTAAATTKTSAQKYSEFLKNAHRAHLTTEGKQ